jgi:hypothetical protein
VWQPGPLGQRAHWVDFERQHSSLAITQSFGQRRIGVSLSIYFWFLNGIFSNFFV